MLPPGVAVAEGQDDAVLRRNPLGRGPVEVGGTTFNGVMPPWGPSLSDEQVAAVTNFVRTSWSNRGEPVTAERVAELRAQDRAQPWTAAELKQQESEAP